MLTPILLTTDAVGGVWRYTIDLARGMAARGRPAVVAVLGPGPDAGQAAEARAIAGLNLVRTNLPLDWTATDAAALARVSERLAALAALTGAASVHLHAPALLGTVRWPAPVVVVGHSCVGTWWRAVRGGPAPPDFAWRMAATAAGLRGAAAVIAPSAAQGRAMRDVYGVSGIAVVHNGADPGRLPDVPRDRAVLTAGRLWDEGKGIDAIDAAAPGLGAPIRAAGPTAGPDGASIGPRHLDLLGTLDPAGMAAAYARASVYVSMARYEPFGLSVLEAAGAGLRLVLSDLSTFRELWSGAATFVADPAALPAALHAALDAKDNGGAQDRARQYTLTRMVEGTLAIHRALQKASPSGRGLGGASQGSAGSFSPGNAGGGEGSLLREPAFPAPHPKTAPP